MHTPAHALNLLLLHSGQFVGRRSGCSWSTPLSWFAGNLWCGRHGQPTVLRRNGLVVDARPVVSQELGEPLIFLLWRSSGPCLVRHRMTCKCRNKRVVPASSQCRPQLNVLQPDDVEHVVHATAYWQLPPVCLQLQKVVHRLRVVVRPVARDSAVARQDLQKQSSAEIHNTSIYHRLRVAWWLSGRANWTRNV